MEKQSLIRKPDELKVPSTIKVLIYGQPGIGKTTLALSTPRPLLLDFDGGVHRVNPMHQSDTVQIGRWDDCLDVLKENLSDYQTIIIDTAGKMLDYVSAYLIANDPKLGQRDGSLSLKGYGARKTAFIQFLKQVSVMGKHLVFVAHDREERDGDNKTVRPEIGGSSAGDLIKEIDLVGYMEAVGKKRTISFDPCEKFYGKNTCGLDPVIEVPVLADSRNDFLTGIIARYNESIEQRKEVARNYSELMDFITESIKEVETADNANDCAASIMGLQHVWDSKLRAGVLLKEHCEQVGLVFNKTTRKFEQKKAA